jgi:hypothetical protein
MPDANAGGRADCERFRRIDAAFRAGDMEALRFGRGRPVRDVVMFLAGD